MTPDADLYHAMQLEQDGDVDGAARLYESILIYSENPTAANNLGTIHSRWGQPGIAASFYRKAIAWSPTFAMAHFNLGNAQEELKLFDEAMKSYREAIRLNPRYSDAHYNLALILENKGEQRQAIKHWRAYVKIEPTGPWASHARSAIRKTLKADCLKIVYRRAA